ncbi:MAG TPA: hypothetical protein VG321_08825 [Solirubrobacteraceae bacterium]|nr:hypothetical protein [Solirubrobacteraceae bacterium]
MNRRPIQVLAAATAVLCAVAAVVGGAGAAAARTRAVAASSSLPASLGDLVCHRALAPAKRRVAATAFVHPITGSSKVAVRFRLLRRIAPGETFTAVHGSGLNTWLTKSLGATSDSWRVIHTVSDLYAPAAYRFAVGFRWIGSGGQILAHTVRFGRICHQPELRPDLEVVAIDVQPDSANAQDNVYRAQIHDAGATGAGPFQVQLSDQGTVHTRRVIHIRAHRSLWVRLAGPLCDSSQPPVVTVDPKDRVDVYSRSQASLTATCPPPSSTTSTTTSSTTSSTSAA